MSSSRQALSNNEQQMKMQMQRKKAPNFVQTCNLLSQYMKQKGSLRDLNLEIDDKVESLEALVRPRSGNSVSVSATINVLKAKGKSAGGGPCEAPYSSINTLPDASNSPTSEHAAAAPLTIFYSGSVLVFNDYPADMVKELLALAEKESSRTSSGISSNALPSRQPGGRSSPAALPPRVDAGSPVKTAGISLNSNQEKTIPSEANSSAELRIARRTSIHKFLAKRKDRAAARGPYHHHQGQEQHDLPSSSSSEHLDLKL